MVLLGVVDRHGGCNLVICNAHGDCLALSSRKEMVSFHFRQFDRTYGPLRCLNLLIWWFLWWQRWQMTDNRQNQSLYPLCMHACGVITWQSFCCGLLITIPFCYIMAYAGESIEVLDIGLRKTHIVPVVHRVKPSTPTHRFTVGSPKRNNIHHAVV